MQVQVYSGYETALVEHSGDEKHRTRCHDISQNDRIYQKTLLLTSQKFLCFCSPWPSFTFSEARRRLVIFFR